jgi:hypothetical protein
LEVKDFLFLIYKFVKNAFKFDILAEINMSKPNMRKIEKKCVKIIKKIIVILEINLVVLVKSFNAMKLQFHKKNSLSNFLERKQQKNEMVVWNDR